MAAYFSAGCCQFFRICPAHTAHEIIRQAHFDIGLLTGKEQDVGCRKFIFTAIGGKGTKALLMLLAAVNQYAVSTHAKFTAGQQADSVRLRHEALTAIHNHDFLILHTIQTN